MVTVKANKSVVRGVALLVMALFIFLLPNTGCLKRVLAEEEVLIAVEEKILIDVEEEVLIDIEEISYKPYLEDLLLDTGLVFIPAAKNGFVYYELRDLDERLKGFIFLGERFGWAGPIRLFVKTDIKGTIQSVYVWHHIETPEFVIGLNDFLITFRNHKAEAELWWHADIHGLTGATFTAEAIIKAVRDVGIKAYEKGVFSR